MKKSKLLKLFRAFVVFATALYFFTSYWIANYTHGNWVFFMVFVGLFLIAKLTLCYHYIQCSYPGKEEDSELIRASFRQAERARLKKAIQQYEQLINPKTN